MTPVELHEMDPAAFRDEVHSFSFWFDSVRGYADSEASGQEQDSAPDDLEAQEREGLIHVLCDYCIGETAALEGAGALIRLAPNRAAKIFLATQAVDEARHLEVLINRLRQLGVQDVEHEIAERSNPSLRAFKDRLLELIESGDWAGALFAQNVVLEAMEFSAFNEHAKNADPTTRNMLEGIIKDERRHIGFGENELGRQLKATPWLAKRLREVRSELDVLVLGAFDHTMSHLQLPADRRGDLGRSYLQAVERLGFA
jgi:1,2-phenylacetyl-CoA epoxidase catalytic subunit